VPPPPPPKNPLPPPAWGGFAAGGPPPPGPPPPPPPPPPVSAPTRRVCRKAPGSDTLVCRPAQQEQGSYRLPKYGPAAPQANSGDGVKLRAQASNRARRNRPMATVGIPF
jgi:hypothetical protein